MENGVWLGEEARDELMRIRGIGGGKLGGLRHSSSWTRVVHL